jgi:hypothetical protein
MNMKKIGLQIVTFSLKKIRVRCPEHGIQRMVGIPHPTPREIGGAICIQCLKEKQKIAS